MQGNIHPHAKRNLALPKAGHGQPWPAMATLRIRQLLLNLTRLAQDRALPPTVVAQMEPLQDVPTVETVVDVPRVSLDQKREWMSVWFSNQCILVHAFGLWLLEALPSKPWSAPHFVFLGSRARSHADDMESIEAEKKLPRKTRKMFGGWVRANLNAMRRNDFESQFVELQQHNLALRAMTLADILVSKSAPGPSPPMGGEAHPPPLFKNGQSVCQWWASWMKGALAPPESYNKKQRPAWFSAEVCTWNGWTSIQYAGIQQPECHTYHVH